MEKEIFMTTENSQKSNILPIVILVILGAIAVFAIGIIIGNIAGGDASPPAVMPPTPAPGSPNATAKTYVNVRTGPSVQYPILGIAPPGSSAEVIGKSEDSGWWVVKLPTNLVGSGQGWISGEFSTVENAENVPVIPAPPLEEIIIPTPQPGTPTAEAKDAINVRSGPGTNYASYGVAPKGMLLEVTGKSEDGDWWVVKIPTQYVAAGEGWVSGDYVKTQNTDGVPVVPTP